MHRDFPVISVIIPTYNRSADLKRALRSVFAQTLQDFEVIIVDNHSSDDTDTMLAELNDPRIQLQKIHNKGVIAASRNQGIRSAKGKYIALLDSDDWWIENKLELSVKQLEKGYDLTFHEMWVVSSEDQKKGRKIGSKPLFYPVYQDLLKKGGVISNSSVVVRKEIIQKVNGFSEEQDLILVEDYDCWLRISTYTERFFFISESLGYYWNSGQNSSNNLNQILIANQRLFDLYLKNNGSEKQNKLPLWFMYNMARANFLLGNKNEVKRFLIKILFTNSSMILKGKSLYMLVKSM
jgi:glycosyltransferase involved in cell wall biosynthesis